MSAAIYIGKVALGLVFLAVIYFDLVILHYWLEK